MSYRFIYSNPEHLRVIPAVILDSKGTIPAINNVMGFEAKVYTDAEVAKITEDVLFYRIETNNGNLAAYVALNGISGAIVTQQLRTAFKAFSAEITTQISNFINNNGWKDDIL